MFVPLATRLASEWPADLLLLGVYGESESDWPGIDCDQRDVTVIQSSEIRASVIEKSVLSGTIHCFSHESPTIIS